MKNIRYISSTVCLFFVGVFSPFVRADGMNALMIGAPLMIALIVIVAVFACVLFIIYQLINLGEKRNPNSEITLIILENKILISNQYYGSSTEIEGLYDEYISSVGPCGNEEMVDLLIKEFPDLKPSASQQVEFLQIQKNNTVSLLFKS